MQQCMAIKKTIVFLWLHRKLLLQWDTTAFSTMIVAVVPDGFNSVVTHSPYLYIAWHGGVHVDGNQRFM
jgi:hypothetical protein